MNFHPLIQEKISDTSYQKKSTTQLTRKINHIIYKKNQLYINKNQINTSKPNYYYFFYMVLYIKCICKTQAQRHALSARPLFARRSLCPRLHRLASWLPSPLLARGTPLAPRLLIALYLWSLFFESYLYYRPLIARRLVILYYFSPHKDLLHILIWFPHFF